MMSTSNYFTDETWEQPPLNFEVFPKEVHIWRADLSKCASMLSQLLNTLSEEEKGRASRYARPQDAAQFVTTRGLLRMLIGRYLDEPASRLTFRYAEAGKPALANCHKANNICFNTSHSKNVAIFAFTCGIEVGIDTEEIVADIDVQAIASTFFSPGESSRLSKSEKRQQLLMFYRLWTCKEACAKALGTGLSISLDHFDFLITHDRPASLLSVQGNTIEDSEWYIKEFSPADNYVAALALTVVDCRFCYWSLT